MKKFKFSILALIIGMVCSLGLFGFSGPKNVYAAEPEEKEYYFAEGVNSSYLAKTTNNVGSTSGYGNFVVGATNVKLTAQASLGYQIVGWRVSVPVDEVITDVITEEGTSTKIFNQDVTLYTNITVGGETYEKLYKREDGSYFSLDVLHLTNSYSFADDYDVDVQVLIEYKDVNGDSKSDVCDFKIERVFSDLLVDPIYNYIYYNLEITSFIDKIKLPANEKELNSDNKIFYESETVEDSYNKLNNSVLKLNDKYYVVNDAYEKDNKVYAKHQTLKETTEYVNIVEEGAFRLNEEVEYFAEIDFDASDIFNSKNIDILSAKINNSTLTKTESELTANSYKITKDSTLKTSKDVRLRVKIANTISLSNELSLIYDELYAIAIDKQIDGISNKLAKKYENVTLDGVTFVNLYDINSKYYEKDNNGYSEISLTAQQITELSSKTFVNVNPLDYSGNLYENVTINNALYEKLYKVDNEYFYINNNVRIALDLTEEEINTLPEPTTHVFNDAKDLFTVATINKNPSAFIVVQNQFSVVDESGVYLIKENSGFKIMYRSTYSEITNVQYDYYDFGYITNVNGTNVSNSTEQIYNSVNSNRVIQINYTTKTYKVYFRTEVNNEEKNLNTLEEVNVYHGQSLTISDYANNIGYEFIGYKNSLTGELIENEVVVKINRINPTNIVVYLSYQYVEYTLKIENLNSIQIGSNFALSSLKLNVTGLNIFTEEPALASTITFATKLNINDEISLIYRVNNGFAFNKFSFDNLANFDADSILFDDFILDEDVILNQADADNVITIYAYEDFKYYTFTYKINPSTNTILNESVIMANISVDAPYYAVVEYVDVNEDEVDAEAENISTITISGLKYLDEVTLKSEAKEFTDNNNETDYYAFKYFLNSLGLPLANFDDGNLKCSTVVILNNNDSVSVVYSMPVTTLTIFTTENAYSGRIKVEDETTELSKIPGAILNEYQIQSGARITISLLDSINFGYILEDYKLYNNGTDISDALTIEGYVCSFNSEAGQQELFIHFKPIEYRFYVKQNSDELTDVNYNFGTPESPIMYQSLSTTNRVLLFDRPLGYYVDKLLINNLDYGYSQTNESDSRVTLFSLNFGYNFESVVGEYNPAVHSNGIQDIYVSVEYVRYLFKINIDYVSAEGRDYLGDITKPSMQTDILFKEVDTTLIPEYVAGMNYEYNAIPYGAKITIKANGVITQGVRIIGFTLNGTDVVLAEREIVIDEITSDLYFNYKLELIEYIVGVSYDGSKGELDNYSSIISILDSFELKTNPFKSRGFTFQSYTYEKPVYSEYIYNSETWAEDWNNLYILIGGVYYKNVNDSYIEAAEYFTYSTEEVEHLINPFTIYSFNLQDYAVQGENFNIVVNFKELEIGLEYINNDLEIGGVYSLIDYIVDPNGNKINISKEDYASYELYVNNEKVNNNSKFTVSDNIKIVIKINKNAYGYDLSKGVSLDLNGVKIANVDTLTLNSISSSEYYVEFGVGGVIGKLNQDTDMLEIYFNYKLNNRTSITTTTNIKDNSMYSVGNLYLQLGVDGAEVGTNGNNSVTISDIKFLGSAKIDCWIGAGHVDSLRIKEFAVYDKIGNLINKEDYFDYGLRFSDLYKSDDGGANKYSLYFPVVGDGFTIEFIVEPVIKLGGVDIDNLVEYTFEKDFKYEIVDNAIVAVPNLLTIGLASSDVTIPTLLQNKVTLVYKQNNEAVTPINVGDYEVEFIFNNAADHTDWVNNLKVTTKVYLKINPKEIYLGYKSSIKTFEKSYDGTNRFVGNKSEVMSYFAYSDKNGNKILDYSNILSVLGGFYKNTSNKYYESLQYYYYVPASDEYVSYTYNSATWTTDYANLFVKYNNTLAINQNTLTLQITKTDNKNQVVVTNVGEGYNISVSNVELLTNDINENFVLKIIDNAEYLLIKNKFSIKPKTLTIDISKAKIENKVYDGSSKAKFTADSVVSLKDNEIVGSDVVSININKITLSFDTAIIGTNKELTLDATKALEGTSASNYCVELMKIKNQSIYPYSVSTYVEGFGEVMLYNQRGLEDNEKANLIPIGAELKVVAIKPDTSEYVELYKYISSYLSRTNVFVVGYKIVLEVDNIPQDISNELYLSLPNTSNVSYVLLVSGEESSEYSYYEDDGQIIVDLSSVDGKLDTVAITQSQRLLELWQILLIVSGSVIAVGGAVTSVIVIRVKGKRKSDSLDRI